MKDPQTTLGHQQTGKQTPTPAHNNTVYRGSMIQRAGFPSNVMSNVPVMQAMEIIDLYAICLMPTQSCQPFIQLISLVDSIQPHCMFSALIDNGALANAMSEALYLRIRDCTSGWNLSNQHLRMANGTIVPLLATWRGTIRFGTLQ